MPVSVSSQSIREQIAADIRSVWGERDVHFDASMVPLTTEQVDEVTAGDTETAIRAFVLLDTARPEPDTFTQSTIVFPFRIIGQFRFPEPDSGLVLQNLKEANANALIAVLTANVRYMGGQRRIGEVQYKNAATQEQDRAFFEVEIPFEWRGQTGL